MFRLVRQNAVKSLTHLTRPRLVLCTPALTRASNHHAPVSSDASQSAASVLSHTESTLNTPFSSPSPSASASAAASATSNPNYIPSAESYSSPSYSAGVRAAMQMQTPPAPDAQLSEAEEVERLRQAILETALQLVPQYGWSTQAINAAVTQHQLSSASHGLFPRGGIEIVEYLCGKLDRQMTDRMLTLPLHLMGTTEKLRIAIRLRLEAQIPYMGRWQEAIALGLQPQNAPYTVERLAYLMDEMWHIAGDQSTDINWYTKRGLLSGVYSATELYMTTDRSVGYVDTWNFLERRLEDVITFGKLPSQVASLVGSGFNFFMQSLKSGPSSPFNTSPFTANPFKAGPPRH